MPLFGGALIGKAMSLVGSGKVRNAIRAFSGKPPITPSQPQLPMYNNPQPQPTQTKNKSLPFIIGGGVLAVLIAVLAIFKKKK